MGSYNCPLSYFFQLYLFLVFGSDYRFVIDWITRNPFRCMAWNEADTNLSGRLSSSKTHHPLPLLVGEILRFVYVFASWLYVYVSVCSSSWSARKSLFRAQRLVNTFGESAWLEVRETYLFVAFRDCRPAIMCSCELTDYWSTVPSWSLDI